MNPSILTIENIDQHLLHILSDVMKPPNAQHSYYWFDDEFIEHLCLTGKKDILEKIVQAFFVMFPKAMMEFNIPVEFLEQDVCEATFLEPVDDSLWDTTVLYYLLHGHKNERFYLNRLSSFFVSAVLNGIWTFVNFVILHDLIVPREIVRLLLWTNKHDLVDKYLEAEISKTNKKLVSTHTVILAITSARITAIEAIMRNYMLSNQLNYNDAGGIIAKNIYRRGDVEIYLFLEREYPVILRYLNRVEGVMCALEEGKRKFVLFLMERFPEMDAIRYIDKLCLYFPKLCQYPSC